MSLWEKWSKTNYKSIGWTVRILCNCFCFQSVVLICGWRENTLQTRKKNEAPSPHRVSISCLRINYVCVRKNAFVAEQLNGRENIFAWFPSECDCHFEITHSQYSICIQVYIYYFLSSAVLCCAWFVSCFFFCLVF